MNGTLIFGMKSFNFVHEYLGSQFCLGLDKLLVYNIVSELRMFTRSYGLYNGGGGVSDDFRVKGKQHNKALLNAFKQFDDSVSENFGNLDPNFFKNYTSLIKNI